MGEPVRERRAEHDGPPIRGVKTSIRDGVASRGLHPGIGGEDPEGRKQRPCGDRGRGEHMRPWRHQATPEKQHTEEAGFKEERRQRLVGHQRADDIPRRVRVAAPIGAELERHHHARDDPKAEGDSENLQPQFGNPEIDRVAAAPVAPFDDSDEPGQPDREGREQDMPGDDPGELQPRQ